MLIALSDHIWSRLHGPYGVEDVASDLDALSRSWDEDLARNLFWERLHHQEDLYPVTFAALPWIWTLAPRPLASGDALLFLSHVLDCACRQGGTGCDGKRPRERYRGLSTRLEDHQGTWLDPARRLQAADIPVLVRLEAWFTETAAMISRAALDGISGQSRFSDANVLRGPAAWAGADTLPMASTLWGDGHGMETILEDAPQESQDERSIAMDLACEVEPHSPELARFLQTWAAS